MFSLEGKSAVVTGGASGIGLAIVERFVAAGAEVLLVDRKEARAIELAPKKITVNAVSPGTVLTPAVTSIPNNPEIGFVKKMTPLGRLANPHEIAGIYHFLASDEASYITGQNIAVDGGITSGWKQYPLVPPPNVQNGRWIDD